jgi:hypothetical protein
MLGENTKCRGSDILEDIIAKQDGSIRIPHNVSNEDKHWPGKSRKLGEWDRPTGGAEKVVSAS